MAGVLVDCPEHGIVPGLGFGISGGATIIVVDSFGECSVCRRPAPVVNGSYQEHDGHVHVALELTDDQWSRLRGVLADVVERRPAEPVEEIRQVSPELGDQIEDAVRKGLEAKGKPANWRRRRQLAFGVAGAIFTLLNTDTEVVGDNLDLIRDGVVEILDYVASTGSVPPP